MAVGGGVVLGPEPVGDAVPPTGLGHPDQAVPGSVLQPLALVGLGQPLRLPGVDAHASILERVRSLWPADLAISCGGCMELMVLAHRGGLLLSG
ncbi:MAG: hypothetical protein ACYCS2_08615 [Acidimicrobiales bacterium]